jgi:hypothetical protein
MEFERYIAVAFLSQTPEILRTLLQLKQAEASVASLGDGTMRELSDKEQVTQSGRSLVILIVGPDLPLVARRARLLRRTGYIVLVARAIDHAVRLALDSDCDLVLLCHRFDDGERQAIRNRLKSVRRLLTTVSLQESDDTDPRSMLAQIASTKM